MNFEFYNNRGKIHFNEFFSIKLEPPLLILYSLLTVNLFSTNNIQYFCKYLVGQERVQKVARNNQQGVKNGLNYETSLRFKTQTNSTYPPTP